LGGDARDLDSAPTLKALSNVRRTRPVRLCALISRAAATRLRVNQWLLLSTLPQFYQNLADAFEHDQIDGLTDDETLGQLADIKYEIDSHGRMKIEPKEKARQRGVRSPDRAEALMLALGKPRSIGEIKLVPTNPLRAQSHPIERNERAPYETNFYPSADQSDPNDHPPNLLRILRWSRRYGESW